MWTSSVLCNFKKLHYVFAFMKVMWSAQFSSQWPYYPVRGQTRRRPPSPQPSVKSPVVCEQIEISPSPCKTKKKKDKFIVNICCDRLYQTLQMLFCVVSVLLFFGLAAGETFERLPSAQPDEQKGPCLLFLIHKGLPFRRAGCYCGASSPSGLQLECVSAPFFPERGSVSLKPLVVLPLDRGVFPLSVVKRKQE